MLKIVDVRIHERAVVLKNGIPRFALGPGRHWVWGFHLSTLVWNTDDVLFSAQPAARAVLPEAWFAEVALGARERGVLSRDGKPFAFLRPGTHRFWTVDPGVKLAIFDVDQPVPDLTDEFLKIVPKGELVQATVREHEKGLLFVQGKLVATLDSGRHAFWSHPGAAIEISVVDLRREQISIVGQELMTKDKVTLRLTLTVEFGTVDPALAATSVASVKDAVYLVVQLAAREFVAGVTLDELLEGRDTMTRFLEQDAAPKLVRFGVRLERVGVKDVVLPGEMKTLLNRVIEAEKEAQANVIQRREEVAATRQLANTARVMADNPVLLRLKELDAMKEIAGQIQEVRLLVGTDGMKTLLPADLLGRAITTSGTAK